MTQRRDRDPWPPVAFGRPRRLNLRLARRQNAVDRDAPADATVRACRGVYLGADFAGDSDGLADGQLVWGFVCQAIAPPDFFGFR
jgi:hypothetical protein